MFGAFTVATRLALGATAISLATLLSTHLPGGSIPAVDADATFVVDSTGDESDIAPGDGACAVAPGGPCTLRAAIQEANASSGTDAVRFNVPPSGGYVISPASALPEIVGPLVIDATTQPGYSGQPLMELDGRNVGQGRAFTFGAPAAAQRSAASRSPASQHPALALVTMPGQSSRVT